MSDVNPGDSIGDVLGGASSPTFHAPSTVELAEKIRQVDDESRRRDEEARARMEAMKQQIQQMAQQLADLQSSIQSSLT